MRKLEDDQVKLFNTNYVRNYIGWDTVEVFIDASFPDGQFHLIDINEERGIYRQNIFILPGGQWNGHR